MHLVSAMEFYVPMFFYLTLMLMATHAALPPELYWKRMLPNTSMPKAITELLSRGGCVVSTGHMAKHAYDDQNAHIVEWGQSAHTDTRLQDQLLSNKQHDAEENQLFNWGKPVNTETQLQDQLLFNRQHDTEENQLFNWGKGDQLLSNKQHDAEEKQLFNWGKADQLLSNKQHDSEENQLFNWGKPVNTETQLQDQLLSNKQHDAEENLSFNWGKADPLLSNKQHDAEENLLFNWGKGDQLLSNKQHDAEENQLFNWGKADQLLSNKQHDSEENQLFNWGKPVNTETQLQDQLLSNKQHDAEANLLFNWGKADPLLSNKQHDAEENLSFNWGKADQLLFNKQYDTEENQLFNWGKPVNTETQFGDDHPMAHLFFLEEDLRPSTKLDLHFSKRKNAAPLLPRQITEHIPFSTDKIKEVLNTFSVQPKSMSAKVIEKAIRNCEVPALEGEEKYCATSLESLVDFITSQLGKNVHAISTEVDNEIMLQKFSVKDGVKKLAEDKVIACHRLSYPYVVFFCHKLMKTSAYFVPLEGEDGVRVKAVAVCHTDTSNWNPKHLAFQMLKVKPGTAPICHFSAEDNVVWLPK